jgi:CheY-like chemotaxis protein
MPETQPLVLVVEDNPIARTGVAQLLANRGFEVQTAADGQEAVNFLRSNVPPDVIILDMFMPVLDGWRFLEELPRLNLKATPWIVVTTASPAIGREWAADHGCGGFLRKPFDERNLMEEVQRCLNRTTECEAE